MSIYVLYIYFVYVVYFPSDGSGRLAGGATASIYIYVYICIIYILYLLYISQVTGQVVWQVEPLHIHKYEPGTAIW